MCPEFINTTGLLPMHAASGFKVRHSRNHDLMRAVGFIVLLGAATWLQTGKIAAHDVFSFSLPSFR